MNPLLFLLIILIPVITYPHLVPVPSDFTLQPGYQFEWDLFTWWKAQVIFALGTIHIWWNFKKNIPSLKIWGMVILYLVFIGLSVCFSHYKITSLYGLPNYSEGAFIFVQYSTIFLSSMKVSQKYVKPVILSSFVLVTLGCVLQLILKENWLDWLAGTHLDSVAFPLYGTLGNPNHLGLYLATVSPILFSVNPLGVFSFFLIALSGSRAALVSVATTLTCFRARFYPVILFLLFLSFILFSGFRSTYKDRLFLWKHSLPLLSQTILIGKGPATFINYYPQRLPDSPQGTLFVDRPHNVYIQMWHATGLLSLLILGMIVVASLLQPCPMEFKWSVIGYLIAGLFTDSMVGVTPVFCFILGACWTTPVKKKLYPVVVDKELTEVSMSYL